MKNRPWLWHKQKTCLASTPQSTLFLLTARTLLLHPCPQGIWPHLPLFVVLVLQARCSKPAACHGICWIACNRTQSAACSLAGCNCICSWPVDQPAFQQG